MTKRVGLKGSRVSISVLSQFKTLSCRQGLLEWQLKPVRSDWSFPPIQRVAVNPFSYDKMNRYCIKISVFHGLAGSICRPLYCPLLCDVNRSWIGNWWTRFSILMARLSAERRSNCLRRKRRLSFWKCMWRVSVMGRTRVWRTAFVSWARMRGLWTLQRRARCPSGTGRRTSTSAFSRHWSCMPWDSESFEGLTKRTRAPLARTWGRRQCRRSGPTCRSTSRGWWESSDGLTISSGLARSLWIIPFCEARFRSLANRIRERRKKKESLHPHRSEPNCALLPPWSHAFRVPATTTIGTIVPFQSALVFHKQSHSTGDVQQFTDITDSN